MREIRDFLHTEQQEGKARKELGDQCERQRRNIRRHANQEADQKAKFSACKKAAKLLILVPSGLECQSSVPVRPALYPSELCTRPPPPRFPADGAIPPCPRPRPRGRPRYPRPGANLRDNGCPHQAHAGLSCRKKFRRQGLNPHVFKQPVRHLNFGQG